MRAATRASIRQVSNGFVISAYYMESEWEAIANNKEELIQILGEIDWRECDGMRPGSAISTVTHTF